MKRSRKEIQADVKRIQAAATTAKSIKEIAEMTGITVRKINTSLDGHPIIRNRVYDTVEKNRSVSSSISSASSNEAKPKRTKRASFVRVKAKKEITICDAPALISGLNSCLMGPITIPHYVYDTIVGLGKGTKDDSPKAKAALHVINSNPQWCHVAERLNGETLLVEPIEQPSWRARALVALACKYWSDGYHVTIKTRTSSIAYLARQQKVFDICFVDADDEAPDMSTATIS